MIEAALRRARHEAVKRNILSQSPTWAMAAVMLDGLRYELREVPLISDPTCVETKYMGIPIVIDDTLPAGAVEMRTEHQTVRAIIETV